MGAKTDHVRQHNMTYNETSKIKFFLNNQCFSSFPADAPVASSPGAKNMPLPPIPQNGTTEPRRAPPPRQAREKKIYVAAYDYKPCEEGDLELITVSSLN